LTALHRSEASYLVLDFRDMGYVMGNSMLGVFQEVSTWQEARGGGASPYSISVVTSDRCHDGLLTLVTPPPYEKPKWFFEDLESALEAIALDDAQRDPD
jgi:hypothetical protein